jgi:hypothetical protein
MDFGYLWLPLLLVLLAIPFWKRAVTPRHLGSLWFVGWLDEHGLWPEAQGKISKMLILSALLGIGFNESLRNLAGIQPPATVIPSILAQLAMTGFLVCSASLRLLKRGSRMAGEGLTATKTNG